jgi:hypothetical protein
VQYTFKFNGILGSPNNYVKAVQYTFKFNGILGSPKCEDNACLHGKADELYAPTVLFVCLFKPSIIHTIIAFLRFRL